MAKDLPIFVLYTALKKRISSKIHILSCFVWLKSVLFNLWCAFASFEINASFWRFFEPWYIVPILFPMQSSPGSILVSNSLWWLLVTEFSLCECWRLVTFFPEKSLVGSTHISCATVGVFCPVLPMLSSLVSLPVSPGNGWRFQFRLIADNIFSPQLSSSQKPDTTPTTATL